MRKRLKIIFVIAVITAVAAAGLNWYPWAQRWVWSERLPRLRINKVGERYVVSENRTEEKIDTTFVGLIDCRVHRSRGAKLWLVDKVWWLDDSFDVHYTKFEMPRGFVSKEALASPAAEPFSGAVAAFLKQRAAVTEGDQQEACVAAARMWGGSPVRGTVVLVTLSWVLSRILVVVGVCSALAVFVRPREMIRNRRRRAGRCADCGYRKAALPRCPECGAAA